MDRKRRKGRRYPGTQNLLTREEIEQHRTLIDSITRQMNRARNVAKKRALQLQIKHLYSELWNHNHTLQKKLKPEKTYKGAEF